MRTVLPARPWQKKTKKEALLLTEPPPSIGHRQVVDFATVGLIGPKKKFLVLVDILSGYSEVFRFLLPPTTATVISKLTDFLEFHWVAGGVLQRWGEKPGLGTV